MTDEELRQRYLALLAQMHEAMARADEAIAQADAIRAANRDPLRELSQEDRNLPARIRAGIRARRTRRQQQHHQQQRQPPPPQQ